MKRKSLKDVLQRGELLVGDGAMGTELQRAGLEPGGCAPEWNVIHPDRVLRIQQAYVAAGAQILITNTFGSNRLVLSRYDLQTRVAEFARAGAEIAREAISDNGYVLGDVGPCGGFLEPLGDITRKELVDSMREQIGGLLEGGADAIILETITALDELELGIQIARECGVPCVIASLAFDLVKAGDGTGYKTMMGVTPEQAASAAERAGADVVGANCGTGLEPHDFKCLATAFRSTTRLPIMLQPNAGQPELQGENIVYRTSPEEMAPKLVELFNYANIVGGCCGTSPAHIAALAALREHSPHSAQSKTAVKSRNL